MTYLNKTTKYKTIKQPPQRLILLESLRGFAALLIVAFHATDLFNLKFGQPFLGSLFEFGDSGVDFFFVLSGFFLALSGFKYIGYEHKAKNFLIKRCVRLYPFYWLVNIVIIPIYFLMPSFGKGYEREMGVIVKSLLLIPQDHPPIVSVAWFLTHLIFFYLIFTAIILWPQVFSKVVLGGLLLSASYLLLDVLSNFHLHRETHFLLDFIFSYHNLEFTAGCLIGFLFQRTHVRKSTSRFILLTGCLAFIVLGLLEVYVFQSSPEKFYASDYYKFIAYGVSSVLIISGAAFLEKHQNCQVNPCFMPLGAASFSIYLTHYPVLSICTKAIQAIGVNSLLFYTLGMVFICLVAVLMGCATHFYVEKKLNHSLEKLSSVIR